MAWFVRFTRFLDAHLVYAQEANQSCGIACALMVAFKINKLSPGQRALYMEKEVYRVFDQATGTTGYDGTKGTDSGDLAKALNKLGSIGQWRYDQLTPSQVPQAVVDSVGADFLGPVIDTSQRGRWPIILGLDWTGGGGHWVVVDTVNHIAGNYYASVCDPWDGDVHVTKMEIGKRFDYTGAPVPFSWDLGGTRHDYNTPSVGGVKIGDVIRRIA
jgi:hypothetical protein